ncbi:hypothetical protein NIES4071_109050 (plasmid) [Calothrix sp. NIES-4071]|nr:hypothetical protein NIES4071_109050 [Calothrix sp. NIES-4071]BAZ65168.1 hypothetical protein NIES4105_109010 [Calothrix sp. NIES-4105]
MTKIQRESINFKLPKSLCDELRSAAITRNTTATDLVIQGLHHVLGDVPGVETSVEIRLYQLEEEFFQLKSSFKSGTCSSDAERISRVEEKLSEFSNQLSRFEGALRVMQNSINASRSRRSGGYSPYNQYNSQPPQLQPFDELSLSRRLNTNVSTLQEKRATLSQEEFERWCKDRDTSQYAWRFNEKDNLYHPIK